jgi:preprotein translocase subunit SecF
MSEEQTTFNINFMGQRKLMAGLSVVLMLASLIALFINGLNLGLDFTGGTQMRVAFDRSVNLDTVRQVVREEGFADPVVVYYGSESEVMIRFQGSLEDVAIARIEDVLAGQAPDAQVEALVRETGAYQTRVVISGVDNPEQVAQLVFPPTVYGNVDVQPAAEEGTAFLLQANVTDPIADTLVQALEEATGADAALQDLSYVGSQVGDELADNAVIGLLVAFACVMLYVALRFQYKFSVGAVAALIHDVLLVVGLFAIFQWQVDLTVFAAVLAVIGYSINDTIVIFDRVRENLRKVRKGSPEEIINLSINQTFERTLVTSFTTLLVLFSLFLFGGETVRGFSMALMFGILVGTYSTYYMANNIILAMNISKEDLAVPVKEGAEFEEVP